MQQNKVNLNSNKPQTLNLNPKPFQDDEFQHVTPEKHMTTPDNEIQNHKKSSSKKNNKFYQSNL